MKRQVSTSPEKIKEFFDRVVEMDAEFMAILESCGFNDWLIEELRKRNCREIVLIHPERPSKKKTDRRDAQKLCDLLWLNRDRLAERKPVHGLRRIYYRDQTGTRGPPDHFVTSGRQLLFRLLTTYDMWQYAHVLPKGICCALFEAVLGLCPKPPSVYWLERHHNRMRMHGNA